MANGKEDLRSLRDAYRHADFRPFKAQHRNGRWAFFLGLGPRGNMIGWWEKSEHVEQFETDSINWHNVLRFMR